ncbi:MAG: hypothetical protein KF830_10485 [Planctomycetes bacterium]|nr:hypothetical protein [Planctomycetota bacterium]
MLRALERDPHTTRLNDLLRRFRAQELSMAEALHDLQTELEGTQREAIFRRGDGAAAVERLLRRCSELQGECDLLATELVHVRLAIAGTGEELAEHHERRVQGLGLRAPA